MAKSAYKTMACNCGRQVKVGQDCTAVVCWECTMKGMKTTEASVDALVNVITEESEKSE